MRKTHHLCGGFGVISLLNCKRILGPDKLPFLGNSSGGISQDRFSYAVPPCPSLYHLQKQLWKAKRWLEEKKLNFSSHLFKILK
jgi:hypothetical protein